MNDVVCETCEQKPGTEPHPCPYRSEIYEDEETLCNCCDECRSNCCDDV